MEKTNTKDEINKELEDISPMVFGMIRKKPQDEVPFRYFDNLSDRVMDKISIQDQSKIHWLDQLLSIWTERKRLILAMATIIGVLVIAGVFLSKSPNSDLEYVKLDHDEIKSYLLSQATDLEDEQLSLLHSSVTKAELLNLTEEDLKPVLEEYLDQINTEDLN